ncbi:MAG: alpha amylase catalytic region [Herbinix sp.]|jgi:sucrose phosphorylase|nr:alpha amylase catalytic region [Herbinix sp.]
MKNQIMLITYADSFGKNLKEMKEMIDNYFRREIGSIHILPFFPSSGDRGFAPLTYEEVDSQFGTWADIDDIAKDYELMFDFMVNHLSRQSEYFIDFIEKHEESKYKDLFLRFKNFWPNGEPTTEEVAMLNKRKPHAPCVDITFADGSTEKIWCTFGEEQMDLDMASAITWEFIERSLECLMDHGATLVRLDAFAFATKKLGTSCFFVEPEMWDLMKRVQQILDRRNIPMLPEIHDHYIIQEKIADHGYYIYDFALPTLVLHTIYTRSGKRLKHWLNICPRKQYTTLDTHDGIGTVDVKDLLTEEEIEAVCDRTLEQGANFKMDFSAKANVKPVVYQINCTYYSAVGSDEAYLLSRAIQFFAPGIPQVYYVGLLAGDNDYELMKRTDFPRNISRHNYTVEEIREEAKKQVVAELCKLMCFRNEYPAFDDVCRVEDTEDHLLHIYRSTGEYETRLLANLENYSFTVTYKDLENGQWCEL